MKKIMAILLMTLISCIISMGCGNKQAAEQKQPLKVYSFSGENEQFAITNGVIVLNTEEEIFYGGTLEEKQDQLSDIAAYSETFYIISDGEKRRLMSNRVEDISGGTVNLGSSVGKMSGDIIAIVRSDDLKNNLYYELKTTDLSGEKNEYQIQLNVTEITGDADD